MRMLSPDSGLQTSSLSHFSQLEANRKYVAMVQQVMICYFSADIFILLLLGSLHPLLLLLLYPRHHTHKAAFGFLKVVLLLKLLSPSCFIIGCSGQQSLHQNHCLSEVRSDLFGI